jgi:hypothetical protein
MRRAAAGNRVIHPKIPTTAELRLRYALGPLAFARFPLPEELGPS